MKLFDNPYFQNVVSEFIALVLIVAVGWLLYDFSKRRKLLKFFGVGHSKRIVVYLSNLRIQPGGALGVDGAPRSFSESAVPAYESDLVPVLQRLFNFIVPGVQSQPGFLRSLVLSDVTVTIRPSPLLDGEVERGTPFIAVGSPGYNVASQRLENELRSIARFARDNTAIELNGVSPMTDARCGFVQRVFHRETGQTAFYVAGISSRATTGAAHFLASRWDYLAKKYPGKTDFCVVLRVTSADAQHFEIVLERG